MKLIRILKRRGKSGFTLVEVIISCVLLGILIVGVFSIVTPILSGVKSSEQSANALMLAEAAESYIDRSIKNSVMVAIFENVNFDDDMGEGETVPDSDAVKEMLSFIKSGNNKDAAGNDVYELKCISICWKYDGKLQDYKYMIADETIDKDKGIITKGTDVFETCFYESLYPAFSFESMEGNVYTTLKNSAGAEISAVESVEESGVMVEKVILKVSDDKTQITNVNTGAVVAQMSSDKKAVLDGTGATILTLEKEGSLDISGKKAVAAVMAEVPAIKTVIDVYREQDMYNLAFRGTGYADFTNIKRGMLPESKLYPRNDVTEPDGTVTERGTCIRTRDEYKNLYGDDAHPSTYIYYVTRKLKATTPTTPSSTSSTSSSSSTTSSSTTT